jgi:hypothetical protein
LLRESFTELVHLRQHDLRRTRRSLRWSRSGRRSAAVRRSTLRWIGLRRCGHLLDPRFLSAPALAAMVFLLPHVALMSLVSLCHDILLFKIGTAQEPFPSPEPDCTVHGGALPNVRSTTSQGLQQNPSPCQCFYFHSPFFQPRSCLILDELASFNLVFSTSRKR